MKETELITHLSGEALAEYLGISQSALSRAARQDYNAGGHRVADWAHWHHNGKRIHGYDVPDDEAREIIPEDEWSRHDLDLEPSGGVDARARNPRMLPVANGEKARARHAARLLRSLKDVDGFPLDPQPLAEALEAWGTDDEDM